MKYEYTNDYTTAPYWIECPCCSFDARLEAKEDTRSNVTWYYSCTYSNCKKETSIEDAEGTE